MTAIEIILIIAASAIVGFFCFFGVLFFVEIVKTDRRIKKLKKKSGSYKHLHDAEFREYEGQEN